MTPLELESYLHRHIPLSVALGVRVREAEPARVVLDAPLGPNLNHRDSVFGGSAASVAMLAGWSLVRLAFGSEDAEAHIVIRNCRMRFLGPITADFSATCRLGGEGGWDRVRDGYRRKGIARIATVTVVAAGQPDRRAAVFDGEFVVAGQRFHSLRFG